MKDNIIRGFRILIGLGMFLYIIYLAINKATIVPEGLLQYNLIIIIFLGVLYLLFALMGMFDWCLPKPRLSYFLLGIFLILFGTYMMIDNPASYIFLADLTKVFGVIIIITGPTGILIPEKCKKEQESKNVEIVEV